MPSRGVLLTAFGSPDGLGDVERFLQSVLGRAPTPGQVEWLRHRYEDIGGRSPLRSITSRQGTRLAERLGPNYCVRIGMRHSSPSIDEAVDALVAEGIDESVVIPLAPHDSSLSVGRYLGAARAAFARHQDPPTARWVHSYCDHPQLLGLWGDTIDDAIRRLRETDRRAPLVVFTAHSLPVRGLPRTDPYPSEVRRTAHGIANRLGVVQWSLAFQSGRGRDWLGPDLATVLSEVAKRGFDTVIVAPIGFVSDHLETLYDLDIEAARLATELGLGFIRVPAPNDDPRFINTLVDLVQARLPQARPSDAPDP